MVIRRDDSGGTDETILKYDVSHMRTVASYPPNPGSPIEVNRDHDVCLPRCSAVDLLFLELAALGKHT